MTAREAGFLLLTSWLGDPERKPLTLPQLRRLGEISQTMKRDFENRELTWQDLAVAGCEESFARRVADLLTQEKQLNWYVGKGASFGCVPITRIGENYPRHLRRCLGQDTPGVLWFKGDPSLMEMPAISLVGSRNLKKLNFDFAREVGKQAALQGFVLVSGNARGADSTAQEACLSYGGKVISIVAEALYNHKSDANILYIAEDGYDIPFSAHRALRRNRLIHVWGEKVFVAQCNYGKGGTWNGTCQNLQKGWHPVFCCNDRSPGISALTDMGAIAVDKDALSDLAGLQGNTISFFDP